jgi:hypothetical protein
VKLVKYVIFSVCNIFHIGTHYTHRRLSTVKSKVRQKWLHTYYLRYTPTDTDRHRHRQTPTPTCSSSVLEFTLSCVKRLSTVKSKVRQKWLHTYYLRYTPTPTPTDTDRHRRLNLFSILNCGSTSCGYGSILQQYCGSTSCGNQLQQTVWIF